MTIILLTIYYILTIKTIYDQIGRFLYFASQEIMGKQNGLLQCSLECFGDLKVTKVDINFFTTIRP